MEIFKLFGSIFVDNDSANQKIDETDKKAEKTGGTFGKMIGTAAKWGAGILAGAGAAGGGLLALANRSADTADVIDKLSERTGINREELQRWKYAADQSGADISKLEVGIKTLSGVMDDAANGNKKATEAFDKLGISMGDLKNKSQEDIFETVMASLADMEQGAERNALGNDLLGRSFTEMLPLLNAGSEGMQGLKDRADELGLVMSEESVKANVVFGDTMADVRDSLGMAVTKIGSELLPMFQTMLDWVLAHMPEIQNVMGTVIGFIANIVKSVGTVINTTVIPALVQIWEWIEPHLPMIQDMFQKSFGVMQNILIGVVDAIKDTTKWMSDHWNIVGPILIGIAAGIATFKAITLAIKAYGVATKLVTAIQLAFNLAMALNPIGLVVIAIGLLVAAGILLWKNWDVVKEKAGALWTSMKEIFGNIKGFVLGVWDDIVGGIKTAINAIIKGINWFIGGLNKIKVDIPEWVQKLTGMGKSFGINIPEIPLLAKGTDFFQGGLAIVGEQGPELLNLPKGSQVKTAEETERQLNQPEVIETTVYLDGEPIAKAVSKGQRKKTKSRSRMIGVQMP